MDMREKIAAVVADCTCVDLEDTPGIADAIIAALKEQEPVAWVCWSVDGDCIIWSADEGQVRRRAKQYDRPVELLYAIPIPPVEQADSAFLSKHSLREALRQIETQTVEPRCAAIARAALFGQQPGEKS